MKRYVKPELYYESFEMTEHIAGTCNTTLVNSGDPMNCKGEIDFPGMDGKMEAFTTPAVCGDNLWEDYCYTVATGISVIATS